MTDASAPEGYNTSIPAKIMTPDRVDTRIGTLEFIDGFRESGGMPTVRRTARRPAGATAPGDDDVADLLTRAEALRERARGLTKLIAERVRGFDRELAAVADELETVTRDTVARSAGRGCQTLKRKCITSPSLTM